jgi:hypothetical protein
MKQVDNSQVSSSQGRPLFCQVQAGIGHRQEDYCLGLGLARSVARGEHHSYWFVPAYDVGSPSLLHFLVST